MKLRSSPVRTLPYFVISAAISMGSAWMLANGAGPTAWFPFAFFGAAAATFLWIGLRRSTRYVLDEVGVHDLRPGGRLLPWTMIARAEPARKRTIRLALQPGTTHPSRKTATLQLDLVDAVPDAVCAYINARVHALPQSGG